MVKRTGRIIDLLADSGEYTDMMKAGIPDPTTVVRTAAQPVFASVCNSATKRIHVSRADRLPRQPR